MSLIRPDQEELDASHEGARFSYFRFNEGAHFTPEELQYIGQDIRDISRDAEAHLHLLYGPEDKSETFFAHAGITKNGLPDLAFDKLNHGTHLMLLTTIGVNKAIHERIKELLLNSRCNQQVPQRKAA